MKVMDLGGEWTLRQAGKRNHIKATVPGCVHTDLEAAGIIPNPFFRENERHLQWIHEVDWVYTHEFMLDAEFLAHNRVLLNCEGLDTLASISINNHLVGKTRNMFRTYTFDVKHHCQQGLNRIEILFCSTIPYIREQEAKQHLPAWKGPLDVEGGGWVRKAPCNFGWDWSPCLVTCGIWRPIQILAFDSARLGDVRIRQKHKPGGTIILDITAELTDGVSEQALVAEAAVSFRRRNVCHTSIRVKNGKAKMQLTIDNPKLWWPNGMGRQPLYTVIIKLVHEGKGLLDSVKKRIGLRTLRLQRRKDQWGESFCFVVNGIPFFAKGANWIPADAFFTRLTDDDYKNLIGSAADVHMNMLRVWGGGIYEPDVFYDMCDELGICVWQDFMFACSTYPSFDPEFMANVREEIIDNVKRLRHHACIALWCGNNELEQGLVADEWNAEHMSWRDYSRLFDKLIPEETRLHDPDRDYWPSSPHVPHGDRMKIADHRWGDAHLWQVWHGKMPFEWYRTSRHRFISEFGFQSFPEPKTVYGYTEKSDHNITSRVMELHQRSPIGNTTIMTYLLDWFRMPTAFEMMLCLSQILQGIGMKYAIEHWRRSRPRAMGTLYWQLNDCWPVASWSSIDYHKRWKALHFMAGRFFSPLLISGVEDTIKCKVDVFVTSDLMEKKKGLLRWKLMTIGGVTVWGGNDSVDLLPGKSRRIKIINIKKYAKEYGLCSLMLWIELSMGGKRVSGDMVLLARPKHIDLHSPGIGVKITRESNTEINISLTAKAPALWTWLELAEADAQFSDNFFHLLPGEPVQVKVFFEKYMTLQDVKRQLRIRSLIDTYI